MDKDQLFYILQSRPQTLRQIACGGAKGIEVLNILAPCLGTFNQQALRDILQQAPDTLGLIASAAWAGNPDALIKILNVFLADLTPHHPDYVYVIFKTITSTIEKSEHDGKIHNLGIERVLYMLKGHLRTLINSVTPITRSIYNKLR